jgi:hypothetical protein
LAYLHEANLDCLVIGISMEEMIPTFFRNLINQSSLVLISPHDPLARKRQQGVLFKTFHGYYLAGGRGQASSAREERHTEHGGDPAR